MATGPAHRPGFVLGLGSIFRATGFLLARPRTWALALVPSLVLALLAALDVWAATALIAPWIERTLPVPQGTLGEFGVTLAKWSGALATGALGLAAALAITPPLSGPALEALVTTVERELGVPPRASRGFWHEMACGARAQLAAWITLGPVLVLLLVIELLVPGAQVVVTPLGALLAALALGWTLIDYPLTLRDVGVRRRVVFLRRHAATLLGFAITFALAFWPTCCGVLLLPIGVVAATDLLWALARADPDALPELAER